MCVVSNHWLMMEKMRQQKKNLYIQNTYYFMYIYCNQSTKEVWWYLLFILPYSPVMSNLSDLYKHMIFVMCWSWMSLTLKLICCASLCAWGSTGRGSLSGESASRAERIQLPHASQQKSRDLPNKHMQKKNHIKLPATNQWPPHSRVWLPINYANEKYELHSWMLIDQYSIQL